jgi:hypothetical protein
MNPAEKSSDGGCRGGGSGPATFAVNESTVIDSPFAMRIVILGVRTDAISCLLFDNLEEKLAKSSIRAYRHREQ